MKKQNTLWSQCTLFCRVFCLYVCKTQQRMFNECKATGEHKAGMGSLTLTVLEVLGTDWHSKWLFWS